MAGENVDNFFEQTVGQSPSNPLNLKGIVKGSDGTQSAAIADPTGGATVDAESRTAINALIAALENVGIIVTP